MDVVIYGGTGQAKVVRAILEEQYFKNVTITAVIDDTPGLKSPFNDIPIYCGLNEYEKDYSLPSNFVIAIGNPNGEARERLSKKLIKKGWKQLNVKACLSLVQHRSVIGTGIQLHPHSVVMTNSHIGNNCIINTGAIVEHGCILSDNVEIGPGATIAGEVTIGKNTWIGAGATVIDKLNIGSNVIVGAGAVVTKDIPDNIVVVGNPAKFLRNTNEK